MAECVCCGGRPAETIIWLFSSEKKGKIVHEAFPDMPDFIIADLIAILVIQLQEFKDTLKIILILLTFSIVAGILIENII